MFKVSRSLNLSHSAVKTSWFIATLIAISGILVVAIPNQASANTVGSVIRLRNRNWNKCLNLQNAFADGVQPNVWGCVPHGDQEWRVEDAGNGFVRLRNQNWNKCLNLQNASMDGVQPNVWSCVPHGDQEWQIVGTVSWRMPWRSGITGNVNGGWHYDIYTSGNNAIDVPFQPGTPVLAPTNSTVLDFCNAGNNHLVMQLRADDGKVYSLVHVQATGVSKGKKYLQGEQIGVIAGDRPWNNCAKSDGPHLHFGLPNQNMLIDGYQFSPSNIPRTLGSTNG